MNFILPMNIISIKTVVIVVVVVVVVVVVGGGGGGGGRGPFNFILPTIIIYI